MAKPLLIGLLVLLLGPFSALAFVGWGWWTYRRNERRIVERMDRYYLTVTSPGRERYLLGRDETFEVPYMASKLSVAAVPTQILDDQGRVIGEFSTQKGLYVSSPDDLPVFLKRALVASEDGTFYRHHGVNWRAMARAALTDLRHMRLVQGGSTITQQLAKMMFTTRKRTLGRKVFEMFCAWKLEEKFTKDQIMLMYLNFAYFGHGAFGVEAASRYYFGKTTRELDLAQAAMLVGIIPNPRAYSPFNHPELALARQRTVLSRMAKLGFIPPSAIAARSEEIRAELARRAQRPQVGFWKMKINEAPYLVEFVRRRLIEDFSKQRLVRGGLRIHTTFDLDLEKAASRALSAELARLNRARPKGEPPIEGALAALRPSDGALLALVGGSGFDFQDQLDRTQSRRPIGSCVKPFVYASAFESGRYKPDDTMIDRPISFRLPGGRHWRPRNYGNRYYGKVTLETALRKSLNSVAVRLLQGVGVSGVIDLMSRAAGLPAEGFPRNLSLALGTVDASVIDLARGYSIFVNGGRPVVPYWLLFIEARDGSLLRDERSRPAPAAPILKLETCRTMLELMSGVLKPGGTAGTAAARSGFNIPAAGKSGTTNDYRDAWFTGMTPDVSASVWIGHDDMRLPLLHGEAGGAVAAPAWMSFMKAAYRDRPTRKLDALLPDKL